LKARFLFFKRNSIQLAKAALKAAWRIYNESYPPALFVYFLSLRAADFFESLTDRFQVPLSQFYSVTSI
jgi:hypothetical protein